MYAGSIPADASNKNNRLRADCVDHRARTGHRPARPARSRPARATRHPNRHRPASRPRRPGVAPRGRARHSASIGPRAPRDRRPGDDEADVRPAGAPQHPPHRERLREHRRADHAQSHVRKDLGDAAHRFGIGRLRRSWPRQVREHHGAGDRLDRNDDGDHQVQAAPGEAPPDLEGAFQGRVGAVQSDLFPSAARSESKSRVRRARRADGDGRRARTPAPTRAAVSRSSSERKAGARGGGHVTRAPAADSRQTRRRDPRDASRCHPRCGCPGRRDPPWALRDRPGGLGCGNAAPFPPVGAMAAEPAPGGRQWPDERHSGASVKPEGSPKEIPAIHWTYWGNFLKNVLVPPLPTLQTISPCRASARLRRD